MGSGGGGGGGNPALLMQNAAPMEGLPIAGKDDAVGSPYEYGQFQSFLPDIQAEGQNPMATGLRPDMFQFKSPTGVTAGGTGGAGGGDALSAMRGDLARLLAARNAQPQDAPNQLAGNQWSGTGVGVGRF